MLRVESSVNVSLANLWGDVRIGPETPSGFGGVGVDPRTWSFVVWQADTGPQAPDTHVLTPLVRPVLFKL